MSSWHCLFTLGLLLPGCSPISCKLHIRDHSARCIWPTGPHSWCLWEIQAVDACRCELLMGKTKSEPLVQPWFYEASVLFVMFSGCLGRECAVFKATQTPDERGWQVYYVQKYALFNMKATLSLYMSHWKTHRMHCVRACICICVWRANSVAWNPHKMLVAGLQCSALLLQDTTVWIPNLKLQNYPIHIVSFIHI